MTTFRTLVIGATGLVGRELVRQLAARDEVSEVVALGRRDPGARPSIKVSYRVVDFDHLDHLDDAFGVDAVFTALGTTAAKTRDKAQYRHIEVTIPLDVVQRAHAAGATRCGVVSSVGASATSRALYLRQKGELDEAITALGWQRLVIVKPSTLRGEREELRIAERFGVWLSPLVPARYRAVDATRVAQVLVEEVLRDGPAVHVVENESVSASFDR
jgi:uncharacterized protein YbjT (DUF2867 family)